MYIHIHIDTFIIYRCPDIFTRLKGSKLKFINSNVNENQFFNFFNEEFFDFYQNWVPVPGNVNRCVVLMKSNERCKIQ